MIEIKNNKNDLILHFYVIHALYYNKRDICKYDLI